MNTYPEHEKMAAARDKIDTVTDFLEWVGAQGMHVVTITGGRNAVYVDQMFGIRELLAAFFEIDERKIDAEKHAMLADLRSRS